MILIVFLSELDLQRGRNQPVGLLNWIMYRISTTFPHTKNILFLDEIYSYCSEYSSRDLAHWSKLDTFRENIEFLFAISPQGLKFDSAFKVQPPSDPNTFCKQLLVRHRNSFEVASMNEHLKHMGGTYLNSEYDIDLDASTLPIGRPIVWIDVGPRVSVDKIIDHISINHVLEQESVSVLHKNERPLDNDLSEKLHAKDWKIQPDMNMVGCEDQCIILWNTSIILENTSRSRNGLVIVTTQG